MDTKVIVAEIRYASSWQHIEWGGVIKTKENPSRVHLDDEELIENRMYQFGSACVHLPSTSPQQLQQAIERKS